MVWIQLQGAAVALLTAGAVMNVIEVEESLEVKYLRIIRLDLPPALQTMLGLAEPILLQIAARQRFQDQSGIEAAFFHTLPARIGRFIDAAFGGEQELLE